MNKYILLSLTGALLLMMATLETACANKVDYAKNAVVVAGAEALVDGYGAEPYPVAYARWTATVSPTAEKPAVAVFDYGSPVKMAVESPSYWLLYPG